MNARFEVIAAVAEDHMKVFHVIRPVSVPINCPSGWNCAFRDRIALLKFPH